MTRKSSFLGVWAGTIVLGLAAGGGAAADPGLHDAIARKVAAAGKMKMGIRVELLGAGKSEVIYELNADAPLIPASTQKLVSTAAAMCMLSPDFAYRTILAARGEDLVIIGAGDPSCGDGDIAASKNEPVTAMFDEWAARLKAAGKTHIRGDLLFDDSIFDGPYTPPSWKKFNLMVRDCAPSAGLNFNVNCVGVLVKPGAGTGALADVSLLPSTSWIRLKNTAKTAKSGQPTARREGAGPLTISVSGSVSQPNTPASPLLITVTDPGMFFASACRSALAAQGITIQGETKRARIRAAGGILPADLLTVAVHETKLADVLWRANKCSINMYSEVMLKTVGAYAGRESAPGNGSYETGKAAIERFLDGVGVPKADYAIVDGSGRSLEDRASAAMITAILSRMNLHPRRQEWWESLATPGDSVSTLRRRMKDLKGRVYGKTGHIEGVSALSGYVIGQEKQVYVFSILCNDKGKAKIAPNDFQDDICRTLAHWGKSTGTPSATPSTAR